jgi:peptidoglycan/xylan/chitin deacetylase (PgdA/CDA1 family)
LQQLPQALSDGDLPNRSVVVTFDDGYADNLHNAKPLLERYGIPATVFITTGYVGREREFWWDELERLLLQPGPLPERLSLNINGNAYRWELGEAAYYGEKAFRSHLRWKAWEKSPSPRHFLYSSLWELLHRVTERERQRVLGELLRWTGAEPVGRPTHRSLSPDEVLALVEGELVEAGAHTVTHSALSALQAASQREEILGSKQSLQEIIGRSVTSFAYPYGRRIDYDAITVDLVRQAGFACSCSNFSGAVARTTDHLQLPRFQVQDWDGDEFARRLSWWFDA